MSRLSLLPVLLTAVAAIVVLFAPQGASAALTASDQLVLTWTGDGGQLQVDGFGYQPATYVDVRLGSQPVQRTRSDQTGRVRVSVPGTLVSSGQSGASLVLAGRSSSGSSRILVSAVPPAASASGPLDLLPWSLAGAVALMLLAGAVRRLGRRERRYHGRHAA